MVIYVVKPGDSLWSISRRFGVDAGVISVANGLQDIPYLVVGQALVVPSADRTYRVARGDTLWAIGRRFGVAPAVLARLNRIADPAAVAPGTVLRIPAVARQFGYIETNGYIEPSTSANETRIVDEAGPLLTYVSPFSYQVNPDGSLTPFEDNAIIQAARRHRVAPQMVVTNFRGGNFDTPLVDALLGDAALQQLVIGNIVAVLQSKGYYGVNIDFERISPGKRQAYNDFLRRVTAAVHAIGKTVSTALAPKPSDYQTGAWHGAHDYRAHGEIVDFVIIMTYEWGWSGGPPYAVAPIDLVEDVIRYAVSVVPSRKILMGVPLYGYDWPLPFMPGGRWATRVSPQEAVALAARYGALIRYDMKTQSPHFDYTDGDGVRHTVWFEDARSVQAKYLLASRYDLRGVSYWVLGQAFPQNWVVLNDMFEVVKVVR